MHPSAHAQMAARIERYMRKDRHYRVVDFGSRVSRGPKMTHRDLLSEYDCEITGVDIRAGRNVDVVMSLPYRIPLAGNSADVAFAGQVFEHVPFVWASMLELARVLKPADSFSSRCRHVATSTRATTVGVSIPTACARWRRSRASKS